MSLDNNIMGYIDYICDVLDIALPNEIITDDVKFNKGTQLATLAFQDSKSTLYLRNSYECGDVDLAIVIAHELRHLYQIRNGLFDFENYKTRAELSNRDYNLQLEELDANAFAYIILLDEFDLKIDYYKLLDKDVANMIYKRADEILKNEYEQDRMNVC